jgi:hypothetical protein
MRMRMRSIALSLTLCASCVEPVTQHGNDVYSPEVATVTLVHRSAWLPPPPGGTSPGGSCLGAAHYTVSVERHALSWSVCIDEPPGSIDGDRALTDPEWTTLEAALDELVVAAPILCGADPAQFDLILTVGDGTQRAYGDASHECGLDDRPRVGSDALTTVERTMRTMAGL